jgi:hypothetical protein
VSDRAYGLIQDIVERLGGSMIYEREGYRHGAWVIRIGERCQTACRKRQTPLDC